MGRYLLGILVFLLPLQTQWILRSGMLRGQGWEYGTIGIFAVDILLLVTFVVTVIASPALREGRGVAIHNISELPRPSITIGRLLMTINKLGFIGWFVVVLVVHVLFSIVPAHDKGVALIHTLWVLEAIALAWLIARSQHRVLFFGSSVFQFFGFFVLGSSVQALLGLWQFFTQSTFASTVLGLAVHPAWQGGTSVIEVAGERWLRAYGGLPHPNVFGGWLAIAIILVVYLLICEVRPRNRLLLLSCLVFLSAGLAVSFSRSAWMAAGAGIVMFVISFFFCHRRHPGRDQDPSDSGQARMTASILIIITSFSAILLPYRSLFQTRIDSTVRLEQLSIDQRQVQYRQAWELIRQQRWCKGCGSSTVGVAGIGNYTAAVSARYPAVPVWNIQPVHNVFVLMAAELHALSLVWVALILYYIFKRSLGITPLSSFRRHIVKRLRDPASALPMALFAAMVPLLLLDHYLWSLHVGLLLTGTLFGLVLTTPSPSSNIATALSS